MSYFFLVFVYVWPHGVVTFLVRLKARSRQLAAAGEKDLAAILACGT